MAAHLSRMRLVGIYLLSLLAVLAAIDIGAARWRIHGNEPPEYGTWTGVLEVERKVRLLRDFAKGGEVDALILSSSMGDLGLSADVLSREISARLGRSFRVFNFSMGGADLTTYPLLYRFARLVARPKQIWIVSPVSTNPVQKDSLDEKLLAGPVGTARKFAPLLDLSFAFHDLALVRNAAALRDAALYQSFMHRPISNLDLYAIDSQGDTMSWLYNVKEYESSVLHRVNRRDHIMKFVRQPNAEQERLHHRLYFSDRTMAAVADMRALAQRDGAALTLIAFDTAASLTLRDREFLDASQGFFGPLSQYLGAALVDVRGQFEERPYMVSDMAHLNSIGAAEFSRLLASRIAGRPAPEHHDLAASAQVMNSSPDPRWTPFTALVVKSRDDPSATLELQYFQNWGVPAMRPFSNYRVAIRLPDGSEPVVPARVMERGRVLADTSGLPLAGADQVINVQLVNRKAAMGAGLGVPLVSYRWSGERMAAGFYEEGLVAVRSAAGSYSTLDPVSVSWERLRDPARHDWLGIFPVGGAAGARVSFDFTAAKEDGHFTLPPVTLPGTYELRLFRDNGWDSVAVSEPFTVSAPSGSVAVASSTIAAGHSIGVRWSELNHPHKEDWVGLFRAGAKDGDRIAMSFTGGSRQGELQLPVAKSVPPGEYEVRLFSAGGWTRLATSAALTVLPPAGGAAR